MEDHIPIRPDRSLLFGRQTSKWSIWDVVFHENNSIQKLLVLTFKLQKYTCFYCQFIVCDGIFGMERFTYLI